MKQTDVFDFLFSTWIALLVGAAILYRSLVLDDLPWWATLLASAVATAALGFAARGLFRILKYFSNRCTHITLELKQEETSE